MSITSATTNLTLDEAWNEAEAALPEWWAIRSLTRLNSLLWEAVAYESNRHQFARGDTPAAALHNLALVFVPDGMKEPQ